MTMPLSYAKIWTMKKVTFNSLLLFTVLALIAFAPAMAQTVKPKKGIFKTILDKAVDKTTSTDSLNNTDIIIGLKEALNVGTQNKYR